MAEALENEQPHIGPHSYHIPKHENIDQLEFVNAHLSCSQCDYKSFHRSALERHIQAVHDKCKVYECEKCDYKTGHASALKRHQNKIHDKSSQTVFACDECDYTTVHKSALKRHTANRHEKDCQTYHKCSACEYKTTYEFALERHISSVHLKEGSLKCSHCEYVTFHKHALDRHVKTVHEKTPNLSCELCPFKTAQKSALRMHFATVHEDKECFKCTKCGYTTLYKTALQRHQSTVDCGSSGRLLNLSLDRSTCSDKEIVTEQTIVIDEGYVCEDDPSLKLEHQTLENGIDLSKSSVKSEEKIASPNPTYLLVEKDGVQHLVLVNSLDHYSSTTTLAYIQDPSTSIVSGVAVPPDGANQGHSTASSSPRLFLYSSLQEQPLTIQNELVRTNHNR